MAKDAWTQIAMAPLSGILDSRSRPAELAATSFRYKLNFAINRTGALCVQSGYRALSFGPRSDSPSAVANWDAHRVGGLREPINFLFESTATNGIRRLFRGTHSALWYLDNDTSEWTRITDDLTSAVWKAAPVGDTITFANNEDGTPEWGVYYHTVGSNNWNHVLADSTIHRARVAVAFAGFALLLNVKTSGGEFPSRVMWSDFRLGHVFNESGASIAGFKDLDYGDTILNAVELMGNLYVFTTGAIWRGSVNPNTSANQPALVFQKIYSEPKNHAGCLVYPQTLVSTGRELFWWSHDSIWTFNPYLVAPESTEWLLKGSGATFSEDNADRAEIRCCETIVGEYRPSTKEIRYSFPAAVDVAPVCVNNRELVLNVEWRTMHLSDQGWSAYCNFRRTPGAEEDCNAGQLFIGASTADYTLKDLANVFYRENVTLMAGGKTADIPDSSYATVLSGYYARVVGAIPTGNYDEEKTVREFLIDSDIQPNDLAAPNILTLRIGNSHSISDPMSTLPRCSVLWNEQEPQPLKCPEPATVAEMKAEGTRPSDDLAFTIFEQGLRLWYDLRIVAADGVSAPKFHDVAMSSFKFSVALTG